MKGPVYSIIVPVYNEEETLGELSQSLLTLLDELNDSAEVIMIDDGSTDRSYSMMLEFHRQDPRFKIIHFSRNFGHQIAITAGMDMSGGDAVIIMDADLQDPPGVVLEMVKKWREGYDIVYGKREYRAKETFFKLGTAMLFYRLMNKLSNIDIPVNVGDFRLVDRKAVEVMRSMKESHRFVRGMFSWMGFKQIAVPYRREGRFAGKTKYSLVKMFALAVDGIISFSSAPLRMVLNLGLLVSLVSMIAGIVIIVLKLTGGYTVTGWTSLIVSIFFLGGLQLFVMGIIGEYLGRVFVEVKRRPLYVVRELHGIEDSAC